VPPRRRRQRRLGWRWPFFLVKRLVVFFHMIAALFSVLKLQVSTGD
jgi:hypothetical protein